MTETPVWAAEFTTAGTAPEALSTDWWVFNTGRWTTNGELETYTTDIKNVGKQNNVMYLHAYESAGNWYSGRINSIYAQAGGRWEARIKITPQAGFWPAWWFLSADYETNYVEVDAMEEYGDYNNWNSSYHMSGTNFSGPSFTADGNWHTYDVVFSNGDVSFYQDGVLKTSTPMGAGANASFHTIFDLAVVSDLGIPSGTSTMYVDYVRAYSGG